MPELPEVESVRRTLEPLLTGRVVQHVRVRRRDIIHGPGRGRDLLRGCRISGIERHGKQLALHADDGAGPCICVHLGMTGSLQCMPRDQARQRNGCAHQHVLWHLDDGGVLVFRDPRRFGGIWTLPDAQTLWHQRWRKLGPDATRITPARLHDAFQGTTRNVKALLLDQHAIAGLGNIYVDELLFDCRLNPLTSCQSIDKRTIRTLVRQMRRLLRRAISRGGSSVRNYTDGNGNAGRFQREHRVYGRADQLCLECRQPLCSVVVAGRTTVFCPRCQAAPSAPKASL